MILLLSKLFTTFKFLEAVTLDSNIILSWTVIGLFPAMWLKDADNAVIFPLALTSPDAVIFKKRFLGSADWDNITSDG
jgi:hypothetical protein